MSDRRGAALLLVARFRCGGDVVAIASPRSGRGGRPSLSMSADTSGRWGERLAMGWTVKTSDGAEERRGTGEDGGGILRPDSLSLFSFRLLVCYALPSPPEGRERGRGRGGQDVIPSRRCPAAGRSAVRWWRGVAMTSPRSGRGGSPSLSMSADTSGRSGERLAMVWTVKTQTEQKRGEELAKIAAASFALVLSLPSLLLAFVFFSIYNNVYIII